MGNWGSYPGQGGQDAYDAARTRAAQKSDAQGADNMQALQRRYAAIGGLNSGAAIQAQTQLQKQGAQDSAQTQAGIDLSQTQESNEKNFQNDMAGNQRAFQGQQAELGRGLEREKMAQQGSQFQASQGMEQQKLNQEQKAMNINQSMNEWQMKHSGGLLGGGGILGLGVGNGG